jgi:hypothetical protein
MTKTEGESAMNEAVIRRLDALIRLFFEMSKPEDKRKLTEGDTARLLKSVGLTPTEIAKILGKNSATDVAPYLYPKKKSPEEKSLKEEELPAKDAVGSEGVENK